MTGLKPLTLAAILILLAGCRPSPCLTCRLSLFKGDNINNYLISHPTPDQIVSEADGGFTYTWMLTEDAKEALPPPSGALHSNPATPGNKDFGSTLGGAATAVLSMACVPDDKSQQTRLFAMNKKITILSVRTDATRRILDYTCDRVMLPSGTSPRP